MQQTKEGADFVIKYMRQTKSGWHVRLDPAALTPDPTYGRPTPQGDSIDYFVDFRPWELVRCNPPQPTAQAWAEKLDGDNFPGDLTLKPGPSGQIDLILDFGTELEGVLDFVFELKSRATLLCLCGEFLMELEGYFFSEHPRAHEYVHFYTAGVHSWRRGPQGFRYVRLVFLDVKETLTIKMAQACSQFIFRNRPGDLRCDDARFQRAWQTSVYTARLCTRPDTFWDGIKRDRGGWFGDARIMKEVVDYVYHDPRPSLNMLTSLPVDQWANGVPVYSFDAIAMLNQHILAYGLNGSLPIDAYSRIKQFLTWVAEKQINSDGFITRDPSLQYFFDIGFLDWSRMPVGGRFEELSWLQCKHVEGLRTAAKIARWLNIPDDATEWEKRAKDIQTNIIKSFWRDGRGFVHTLNHVGNVVNPNMPGYGGHYNKTYTENIMLGESDPTRQCNALAVLAGIADKGMNRVILKNVLNNPEIEPIITAYFLYYEQTARAACGDKDGAVKIMADYIADLLEDRDAATVIEMHDPRVKDFRKFCNHFEVTWTWPLSYCHGWGTGLVPIFQNIMLGLNPQSPGWSDLVIEPPASLPMAFEISIPTCRGTVMASRAKHGDPICYTIPENIRITSHPQDGVIIKKHKTK